MNTSNRPNQIGIKTINGVTIVFPNDIICLEKNNGHTLVYLNGQDRPLKSLTPLSGFKRYLPVDFIEISRWTIINRNYIYHLEKGKHTLRLTNNMEVKVSETRLSEIMKCIILIK